MPHTTCVSDRHQPVTGAMENSRVSGDLTDSIIHFAGSMQFGNFRAGGTYSYHSILVRLKISF